MTEYKVVFGCNCGCNDPVATTPKTMLEFLANRLEYAGVSETVAQDYARDIRKILANWPDNISEVRTSL